jgi:NTP pyrophosphatase (non-canonical NTP hydrolase)
LDVMLSLKEGIMEDSIQQMQQQAVIFRDQRNWMQFHTLKDLAISVSLEAAELLENFQWKSPDEIASMILNPKTTTAIGHELADVLVYLLLLADCLKIDLHKAFEEKLEINRVKYPVDKSYGKSTKYDLL